MPVERLVLPVCVLVALLSAGCEQPRTEEGPVATHGPLTPDVPGAADPPITAPPEDIQAVADGNNRFAIDLYRKLAEQQPDGNLVVSPYSIRTALAMTYAGARGETAAEMRKVLHFTLPDDRLHPAFGAMAHQLQDRAKQAGFQLNIANRLWGQTGEQFLPEFLALNRRVYGAGFQEVDFGVEETARLTINRWVEERTRDKIKDLLKKGDLAKAVLVLTNAIYFKGDWEQPFPADQTREGPFEVSPGERLPVRMMCSGLQPIRYHAGPDYQAVELPYRGGQTSMIVFLPAKRHGLRELEATLESAELPSLLTQLTPRQGTVYLPKFQTKNRKELRATLTDLGMVRAFRAADFSGITGAASLHILEVIHGGFIEVDERGTEAAAATHVIMGRGGAAPFDFRADQPFLYFIVDRPTGGILFTGRFTSP